MSGDISGVLSDRRGGCSIHRGQPSLERACVCGNRCFERLLDSRLSGVVETELVKCVGTAAYLSASVGVASQFVDDHQAIPRLQLVNIDATCVTEAAD
jgi:hypothetical protein